MSHDEDDEPSDAADDAPDASVSRAVRGHLVLAGLGLAVLVVTVVVTQRIWTRDLATAEATTVHLTHVVLPTPPLALTVDVRQEALADAGLDGANLYEPDLVRRVGEALAQHPWVERVVRVRKQPGPRIDVDLLYRQPVAVVEVLDDRGDPGLLFVDRQGVLLPTKNLSEADVPNLLRIDAGKTLPTALDGQPWGDTDVERAAALAAFLHDLRSPLRLFRLVVPSAGGPAVLEVWDGSATNPAPATRIVWGDLSPEATAEPPWTVKRAALVELFQSRGHLTGLAVDLRNVPQAAGRTAQRPADRTVPSGRR